MKKLLIYIISIVILVTEFSFAAQLERSVSRAKSDQSKDPLMSFLKAKGIDLSKETVVVEEPSRNPLVKIGWISPSLMRVPLEGHHLYTTVIRGFLIGFVYGVIDGAETALHNAAFHVGGEIGSKIGTDVVAPAITRVTSDVISLLIYSAIGLTNPANFPGRGVLLSIMEYDGVFSKTLQQKENELMNYGQSLIQSSSNEVQGIIGYMFGFLRENKIDLKEFARNYFKGQSPPMSKVISYVTEGSGYDLGELARLLQSNPIDLLNNEMYDYVSKNTQKVLTYSEALTVPAANVFAKMLLQHYVTKSGISLQFVKPKIVEILNGRIEVLDQELAGRIDPVFMSLGQKCTQGILACVLAPIAKKIGQSPVDFVTHKSYPNIFAKCAINLSYYLIVFPIKVVTYPVIYPVTKLLSSTQPAKPYLYKGLVTTDNNDETQQIHIEHMGPVLVREVKQRRKSRQESALAGISDSDEDEESSSEDWNWRRSGTGRKKIQHSPTASYDFAVQ